MPASTTGHFDRDDLIDLLSGLMPEALRDDLLEHARRCPRCERLLVESAGLRERARSAAAARLDEVGRRVRPPAARPVLPPRWRDSDVPLGPRHPVLGPSNGARSPRAFPAPRTMPRSLPLAPLTGALAVAVLAAAVLVPTVSHRAALRRVHWLPESNVEITTREPSASRPAQSIRDGLEAYAHHDLKGAERSLGAAEGRGPIEQVRRIYLANTLAQQGRYTPVVGMLEGMSYDLVPEPWRCESRWTLAVALRATGQPARADSVIESLSQEAGPVGERARRALGPR